MLSPEFWASGTIIKTFLGRMLDERIDSRFDCPAVRTPVDRGVDSDVTVPNLPSGESMDS